MKSKPEMRECPLCSGGISRFRGKTAVTLGTRTVTVSDEYDRCDACGEGFYAPGQMDRLQQRAAAAIRTEDGLLTPAEIRAIRQELGLSQSGLEQLLGVGAKTVVRWERGTVVPNRATDNLLRIIQAVPGVPEFLRSRSAVTTGNARSRVVRETKRAP